MKKPFPPPGFTLHNLSPFHLFQERTSLFKIPSPIVTHYWRQHDITTAPGIAWPQSFFLIGEGQGLMFLFRAFMGFSFTRACCLSWSPETRLPGLPASPIIGSCLLPCIRNWNPEMNHAWCHNGDRAATSSVAEKEQWLLQTITALLIGHFQSTVHQRLNCFFGRSRRSWHSFVPKSQRNEPYLMSQWWQSINVLGCWKGAMVITQISGLSQCCR